MNESSFIECNSLEAIDKTVLSELTKFRLRKIIRIEIILTKILIKGNHAVKS